MKRVKKKNQKNKKILTKMKDFKKDMLTLPNLLTALRIAAVPFILWMACVNSVLSRNTATILYFIMCWTDFFDGYLARKYNIVSTTGKLIDPLADKFNVLLPLIVFLAQKEVSLILVLLIFVRELYMFGVRNLAIENNIIIPAGPGGKIKTILQMLGIGFLLATPELFHFILRFEGNPNPIGRVLLWVSLIFSYQSAYVYSAGLKKKLFSKE